MIHNGRPNPDVERLLGWCMIALMASTWLPHRWPFADLLAAQGGLVAWRTLMGGLGFLSISISALPWRRSRQLIACACVAMWAWMIGTYVMAEVYTPVFLLVTVFAVFHAALIIRLHDAV